MAERTGCMIALQIEETLAEILDGDIRTERSRALVLRQEWNCRVWSAEEWASEY